VYSPNGERILTGSDDGTARMWAVEGEKEIFRLKRERAADGLAHEGVVLDAAYSSDGRRLITVGEDEAVRVWNARNGAPIRQVDVHGGAVYGATFNPVDPSLAVSSGRDRRAVVWNVDTGEAVVSLPHDEAVTAAAFNRDGDRVVTGSTSGVVRIWEWRSAKLLGVLPMHAEYVNAAEFDPTRDGTIVAAADDRLAKIYSCATCFPLPEVRRNAEERLRALGVEP
jgi:WD40 repeat protein